MNTIKQPYPKFFGHLGVSQENLGDRLNVLLEDEVVVVVIDVLTVELHHLIEDRLSFLDFIEQRLELLGLVLLEPEVLLVDLDSVAIRQATCAIRSKIWIVSRKSQRIEGW